MEHKEPPDSERRWPTLQIGRPTGGNALRSGPRPGAFQRQARTTRLRTNVGRPHAAREPVSIFLTETDNVAAALWRAHEKPTDTIWLPANLVMRDNKYERVAYEMGAFIECLEIPKRGSTIRFGIWGRSEQVAMAKAGILKLIRELVQNNRRHQGSDSQKLCKIGSLLPHEHVVIEREFKTKVRQQRYRQLPPQDMGFGAVGTFHWPSQQYRPEEVFGSNSEALDPIRMEHSCYIVLLKERSIFQVCGQPEDVKDATLRIRMAYFQVAARSISPVRVCSLQWPNGSRVASHVILENYPELIVADTQAQRAHTKQARKSGDMPSPRAHGFLKGLERITREHDKAKLEAEHIEQSIYRTLHQMHFFRGKVDVYFQLGRLLFEQYMPPEGGRYSLEEFKTMIKQPQFEGRVTEEYGNQQAENKLRSVMQRADELLMPTNISSNGLDVVPTYSAVFTFADAAGDLQLEIVWHELNTASGVLRYGIGETKWTRLDRNAGMPNKILDMCLTNLETGKAWQFVIASCDPVDSPKVPISLQGFSEHVRLNVTCPAGPSVDYPPSTKLKSMRQRTTYRYGLRDTDYYLDLTRFQDRTFTERKAVTQRAETTLYEPRWAVSVARMEWRMKLAMNECLSIGKRAVWRDEPEEWFPTIDGAAEGKGNGFAQLVGKLENVAAFIRKETADTTIDIEESNNDVDGANDDASSMFRGMQIG